MSVPEVAAVYHACIFCPRGGGGSGGRRDGEIILSVPPRGSRASPSESGSSQILSFSPPSHLGNGNLYLQTVGAGGEREILKSGLPSPPTPFHSSAWPARPLAFFPTPPCALFISASASLRRSGSAGPLPHPLFLFPLLWCERASVSNPLTSAHVFAFHGCWRHEAREAPVFLDLDPCVFTKGHRAVRERKGWGVGGGEWGQSGIVAECREYRGRSCRAPLKELFAS